MLAAAALLIAACRAATVTGVATASSNEALSPEVKKLLKNARDQTKTVRGYSQDYYVIGYPGGDVPAETGACTDVVIRSFRSAGVDLQKEVHEDMVSNFALYPKKWGLLQPDANIDHRRVPNLQTFLTRKGRSLPVKSDFRPGDVITWDLDGHGVTHIGVVSDTWNNRAKRYYIIHNIGAGTNDEDRLFDWEITGHYRYF